MRKNMLAREEVERTAIVSQERWIDGCDLGAIKEKGENMKSERIMSIEISEEVIPVDSDDSSRFNFNLIDRVGFHGITVFERNQELGIGDDSKNEVGLEGIGEIRGFEYWVSQGNKWCDFCKIFISNNPLSIRTHEMGQRHKDSVTNRLDSMRKENAAKDKKQKEAAKSLEQIEAKAKRSYQKDLAAVQEARYSNTLAIEAGEENGGTARFSVASGDEWEYDSTSGYYQNRTNGYFYDPNSGFYYSDALGKWVTPEEAFYTSKDSSDSKNKEPAPKRPFSTSATVKEDRSTTIFQTEPSPGLVVSTSLNPKRSVKSAPSSITVNKRKRGDEKPKVVSKEEADALKARETAKKRMEEREKPLLGLYRSY
ncbi:hypothetical protein GIB67_003109 [Kingdonia uniflora]|uniref:Matrin-type domain-containing protein n=1 Tax=Kingdonia uniflora TaxID=39325 RepID=A0A7J7N634_9MAGN|nr:hypothetical protein GIB67_003109 [Kingdonia uniflora]